MMPMFFDFQQLQILTLHWQNKAFFGENREAKLWLLEQNIAFLGIDAIFTRIKIIGKIQLDQNQKAGHHLQD